MKNIVVVDIDGTISKIGDRLKYLKQDPPDWDSFYNDCFEDEPIPEMILLIKKLIDYDPIDGIAPPLQIVFCTGRRECVRKITMKWLKRHLEDDLIPQNALLMRKDGDLRGDVEVKPELLCEAGIKLEDIAFVIDDRNKMVRHWRSLGLICLQPFEGDF